MNFEELFKYCTEINESKNDKCLVCHIPIQSNEKYIKLGCTHIFHPDCIKYKSGTLKCLYCEKTSIPDLINNFNINSQLLVPNLVYCKVILKSGSNKGKFCNRPNCKYHNIEVKSTQIIDTQTNKPIKISKPKVIGCQTLLKSGPKSGQLCGRLDCKYHKIKIIEPITKSKISFNKIIDV